MGAQTLSVTINFPAGYKYFGSHDRAFTHGAGGIWTALRVDPSAPAGGTCVDSGCDGVLVNKEEKEKKGGMK